MEAKLQLVNSRLTKVSAERNPDFKGELSMNQNINVTSIEKFKPENSKVEVAKVLYSFKVDYAELGNITIEGLLFVNSDSKTLKKIIEDFNNKKMDSTEQITIMNMIIQKASLKAFALEEELGLPIHLRLPRVASPKQ